MWQPSSLLQPESSQVLEPEWGVEWAGAPYLVAALARSQLRNLLAEASPDSSESEVVAAEALSLDSDLDGDAARP